MKEIVNGKDISIKDAANFISILNQQNAYHIGFCGTDPEEIENAITEDVSEMVAAVKDGRLVGWIGADTDEDTAEVWGPFIDGEYEIDLALALWEKLLEQLSPTVIHFILFPNRENVLVKDFAEELQFKQKTDQAILIFSEEQLKKLPKTDLEPLTQADHPEFIRLHDEAFPGTYYSGREIIERLHQTNTAFVLRDEGRLAGYVYVEADPEFGGGSIEFIAVHPAFRGKGCGKKLLTGAVYWLFTFDSIDEIKLTVGADHQNALGLYKSVGFNVEHKLYYFIKTEKKLK
ncbi:GNAT family N-acetyltransferase [Virgibacillus kimchii]